MLTPFLLSELEIVANQGAENAGRSLSTFLGHHIVIKINGVEYYEITTIPETVGQEDQNAIGLVSRVCGKVEGNSCLIFLEQDARKLVQILGRFDDVPEVVDFDELHQSMLEETANITVSSFMNSMTSHLNQECIPNAPEYRYDMVGSLVSALLMEAAHTSDQAIVFSTQFHCSDEALEAHLIFLPTPASLAVLEGGLESETEG